jgi:hypothetical protein
VEIALALASLAVSLAALAVSIVIWVVAPRRGWLESVAFVSHLSLAALVFGAFGGVTGALAALFVAGR